MVENSIQFTTISKTVSMYSTIYTYMYKLNIGPDGLNYRNKKPKTHSTKGDILILSDFWMTFDAIKLLVVGYTNI